MAYTDIDKSDDYFNTVSYTGNATAGRALDVGFATDWFWVKERNGANVHYATDSVRGALKGLQPDSSDAESTFDSVRSFTSTGVTVGTSATTNQSNNYVAWNWLAGGSASSNSDGSITSTVSANTTSGFSIIGYTGTGSNATVGHGLNSAPEMVIIKQRNASGQSWCTFHTAMGAQKFMDLNTSGGQNTGSTRYTSVPSSTVLNLGNSDAVNKSSSTYIGYAFHSVKGYSKIGSYVGNGSSDGTFVYTGFKPAWLMVKRIDGTGQWFMFDNKRLGYNSENYRLIADVTGSEADPGQMELLSNGFKWRFTSSNVNGSGSDYLYLAFAENPFVTSTGIPGLAR